MDLSIFPDRLTASNMLLGCLESCLVRKMRILLVHTVDVCDEISFNVVGWELRELVE